MRGRLIGFSLQQWGLFCGMFRNGTNLCPGTAPGLLRSHLSRIFFTSSSDKAWIIDRAMKFLADDNRTLKQQLAIKEATITEQQEELQAVQLKLTHYNDVIQSDDPITAMVIAKEPGMSAVTLNKILAELTGSLKHQEN